MMTTSTLARPVASIGDGITVVFSRIGAWAYAHRIDLAWIAPVLTVAAFISFAGIAGSPQRIDDEGTYTAQAFALLEYGELAHYTYWYDHPPLGWIQIAGYAALTGAFARWDVAVMAGREASIVATLIAAVLLWVLARRVGLGRAAASVAMLLFAVSPLAVQFHRTVYLDNIAMPWLLLAFLLALERRAQLAAFTGAAVAFGIAVLTKETFLLALPILAWVMVRSSTRETRRYTLSVAASVLVLIGGGYLLLAAVKGELLSSDGRVSLMDGVLFQLGTREGSGSLTDPDSLMSKTLGMWWQLDAVLMVAGVAAAALAVFNRRLRPFAVMLLALTAFMFRPGGYLPVPYVIMLIPFAALLIAGVADAAVRRIRRGNALLPKFVAVGVLAAVVGGVGVASVNWTTQLRGFLLADLDKPMRDAQAWLETNAGNETRLIVDDAMWVDLVNAGWDRDNVIWYYKLDTDPAVAALSPNGWRDSDYIITTDSMRTFPTAFPEVTGALDNSVAVASFGEASQAVEVRRILPGGIEGVDAAIDERAARLASLGAQLAANPAVTMSDESRAQLQDGLVDERIVSLLGALAVTGAVDVAGFPQVAGEEEGVRRQVALTSFGQGALASDGDLRFPLEDIGALFTGAYAPEDLAVQDDALVLTYDLDVPTAATN